MSFHFRKNPKQSTRDDDFDFDEDAKGDRQVFSSVPS